ncbi:thioredoxin family protein [Aquimarina sp. MMG016]|uniref:thioredoxin family protein n=1 Tax=Aquimarina sp. MMG016 TaxID=2822690 RepID=UPI001B3A057D|nr:thioredoxin family protein [Aquimarina sp. MMG016]MBQ4819223.1 thioredoxin family protein [Aquimarina sp. MMG016]
MNKLAPVTFVLFFLFFNFLQAQDWKYDFEEAKTLAKQKDQNIVLYFTGSDWCAPCIRLQKNIFSDDKFKKFAKSNFVWVKADFPKRKKNQLSEKQQKKNEELADRYNKRWVFPVILVLNKEGEVIGATGYRRKLNAEGYISLLTSFDSFGR